MTLKECGKLFKKIQDDYYEEYKLYELSSLAVPIVFPLVSTDEKYLNGNLSLNF